MPQIKWPLAPRHVLYLQVARYSPLLRRHTNCKMIPKIGNLISGMNLKFRPTDRSRNRNPPESPSSKIPQMASTPTMTVTRRWPNKGVNNNDLLLRSCLRLRASPDVDQAIAPYIRKGRKCGQASAPPRAVRRPRRRHFMLLGVSTTFAVSLASPRSHWTTPSTWARLLRKFLEPSPDARHQD